jgi:hypothetical protein
MAAPSELFNWPSADAIYNYRRLYRIKNSLENIYFSSADLLLINKFIHNLKQSNGEWSKSGIQRIIRLSSECSRQFVALRNYKIKADVPLDEAFKDPYSKILLFILVFFLLLLLHQFAKFSLF